MEWQGSKVERDVWLDHKILLKVDAKKIFCISLGIFCKIAEEV